MRKTQWITGHLGTTLLVIAALGLTALPGAVTAQPTYPAKPIRLIVPYPPSGSNDFLARLYSSKLSQLLNVQVPVDNRGGGNTIIGNEAVAKSPPDGYTLLLVGSSHVYIPHLYRNIPYDTLKDLLPVAGIAVGELIAVAHPSLPVTSARELAALARRHPGSVNYGASSTGGPTHLLAIQFEQVAGVKMQQVPYKGGGPMLTDLMGGHIQVAFSTPTTMMPGIAARKLKGIAVTGKSRLDALPSIPTFAESGLPGVSLRTWYVINAPAGTPKAVVDTLANVIQQITAMPEVKAALSRQALSTYYMPPDRADAARREDSEVAGKLIKLANIKLTN